MSTKRERTVNPGCRCAPVYEVASTDGNLGNIRNWKFAYLAPVTALGPTWVADLRIEFPVEKSWLVLQASRPGFNSPEEFDRFARFCGDHRSRQGLATSIYEHVLTPLHAALVQLASDVTQVHAAFVEQVEHLYLDIHGDRLQPETMQLVFVSVQALNNSVVEHLDAWWESVYSKRGLSFTLLPNRYLTFEEVRFVEWRTWFEQDLARIASQS